jgi:hypothetical protein
MAARVRHAAVAYGLSFAGAVASMTWEYSHDAAALGGVSRPWPGGSGRDSGAGLVLAPDVLARILR